MLLYRKKIGTLKNVKYDELNKILANLPADWDYDVKCIYEAPEVLGTYTNKYKVHFFKKPKRF